MAKQWETMGLVGYHMFRPTLLMPIAIQQNVCMHLSHLSYWKWACPVVMFAYLCLRASISYHSPTGGSR
jgi:hypothetical protein